jgi:5'-nucleotidase (lipoprotein e(P4) family)
MTHRLTCTIVVCALLTLGAKQPSTPAYENLNSTLWVQTSVEYRAGAIQTYHWAQAALVRGLQDQHWTAALEQNGNFEALPPAVILDLDETVLDNSVFQSRLVASGEPFSEDAWTKWVNERNAGLVPGSIEFLQFAHANGVATLYITNRMCDPSRDEDPTVRLVRTLQLPVEPIADRLFCAEQNDGDKTSRRAKAASHYRILLLFGDQLEDFLKVPREFADLEGRQKLFIAHQALWGERWFQLSNPMYGSWERAAGNTLPDKLSRLRK